MYWIYTSVQKNKIYIFIQGELQLYSPPWTCCPLGRTTTGHTNTSTQFVKKIKIISLKLIVSYPLDHLGVV